MDCKAIKAAIESGKTSLGIEFGSTRIKAVLIGEDHAPLASGAHDWENRLENGVWTQKFQTAAAMTPSDRRYIRIVKITPIVSPLRTLSGSKTKRMWCCPAGTFMARSM